MPDNKLKYLPARTLIGWLLQKALSFWDDQKYLLRSHSHQRDRFADVALRIQVELSHALHIMFSNNLHSRSNDILCLRSAFS